MYRIFNLNGIVFNTNSDSEADVVKKSGAVELTLREITDAGMNGYENIVSPINTKIGPDGAITFTPPEPPSSALLFASLRAERNLRLAATDYLLMSDYPLDDTFKGAVQTYRQALRDLPSQDGTPWDGGGEATPWPELPAGLKI